MNPVPHPLVVLGLDGGTFEVIRPLIKAGRLPHLGALLAEGWHTDLLSTTPPVTLPAWTSFLTSASPARHGVTDLFVHSANSYGLEPATGALRQIPTMLSHLSARGHRVCALGIPGTYPPEPVNGICVSGFDAPCANRAGPEAVSPPAAFETLEEAGGWTYNVFNEHSTRPERLGSAAEAILADIERKETTILKLYRREPWDLFFVHLQASDTVAHHFWHWHDPRSPRYDQGAPFDAVARVYQRLDQMIGKFRAQLLPRSRLLIVSDHGFGGASTTGVYLNRWLQKEGYLNFLPAFKSELRQQTARILRTTLAGMPNAVAGAAKKLLKGRLHGDVMALARGTCTDFPRTLAFSHELDYAPSIWINQRGVFPKGQVAPHAVAGLLEELKERLLTLRCPATGAPLIARVHVNKSPRGPDRASPLPDLVLEPSFESGYRPSFLASPGPGPVTRCLSPEEWSAPKGFGLPGVHHPHGIFMAWGPKLDPLELPTLEIGEAGGLVYPLMGIPIPPDLEIAPPSYLQELLPFDYTLTQAPPASPTLDRGTSAGLHHRLQTMGYID